MYIYFMNTETIIGSVFFFLYFNLSKFYADVVLRVYMHVNVSLHVFIYIYMCVCVCVVM